MGTINNRRSRADLASQIMQWSMPIGEEVEGYMELKEKNLLSPKIKNFWNYTVNLEDLNDIPDLEFALPFVISAWQPFYRVLRKEL